jgi:hypothetical protein
VAPAPPVEPAPVVPAGAGSYNLSELEAVVGRRAAEFPDRAEEWQSYLFFLRDHAAPDGTLSHQFDYLIEDVFRDLLAR